MCKMTETLFKEPETKMTATLVERPATDMTPQAFLHSIVGRDDVNPTLVKEYLDVYERMEAHRAAEEFGFALAAFQAKCPAIKKERKIDLGGGSGPKYAGHDDIMAEVRPLLSEFRLAVSYTASLTEDGKMRAICKVRHGRHIEESEVTLPVPAQMRVNDTQKMGAALAYAKRYALCAALDIVVTDEDTDANGMAQTVDEEQIAILREWIGNTETDEKRFLKWAAIKTLAEMPVTFFPMAIAELKRKAGQKR